jgi:SAM-dependent methyltransferase
MSHTIPAIEQFDEATYLRLNPDIAAVVQQGLFASGLSHYIAHGWQENRPGTPSIALATEEEILSPGIPPEALRRRVHGNSSVESFETIGHIVANNIHVATQPYIRLTETSKVLDFGCGCGRVLRHYRQLCHSGQFWGSDIDPEAIAWCSENLSPYGTFVVNPSWPPLLFASDYFDFIFSISIFTHLPEAMHLAWLQELQRVTKPGGYLLLTTHGESVFSSVFQNAPAAWLAQYRQHGFYYYVGAMTDGLPAFYQTAFHTHEYLHDQWAQFFEIVEIIPKGIANNQDLVLCRKR